MKYVGFLEHHPSPSPHYQSSYPAAAEQDARGKTKNNLEKYWHYQQVNSVTSGLKNGKTQKKKELMNALKNYRFKSNLATL